MNFGYIWSYVFFNAFLPISFTTSYKLWRRFFHLDLNIVFDVNILFLCFIHFMLYNFRSLISCFARLSFFHLYLLILIKLLYGNF